MGDKPLTIPAFLAVMLTIALFITAIFAWGGNIEPGLRQVGRISFFSCLFAFVLCIIWHFYSTRKKPDSEPDLLEALCDPAALFQLGACHLYMDVMQHGNALRLIVAAQNRYDVESQLDLRFVLNFAQKHVPGGVPDLRLTIGRSAVVLAHFDAAIASSSDRKKIELKPRGRCVRLGEGELVRFARRAVLQSEVKTWMTVMAAFGGALAFGGARVWKIDLDPVQESIPNDTDSDWRISELWTPMQSPTIDRVTQEFIDVTEP